VRTDLDSFSDAEAYALMTSGYRMTEHALLKEKCAATLPLEGDREAWTFLDVEPAMTDTEHRHNADLKNLLAVSNELAFKVWKQVGALKALKWVFIALGAAALIALGWSLRTVSFGTVAIIAAALALVAGSLHLADRKRMYHKRIDELLLGLLIALVLWIPAWLHLRVFDPMFLRYGRWPPDGRS
jgi:hypothetical protein